jgi:hypothetical protein
MKTLTSLDSVSSLEKRTPVYDDGSNEKSFPSEGGGAALRS